MAAATAAAAVTTIASGASPDVQRRLSFNRTHDTPLSGLRCKLVGNPGVSVNQRSLGRRRMERFAVNCGEGGRDLRSSALMDGIADSLEDSLSEMVVNEREPGVSTILASFENSFDPYGALSTPLYQTSTFKQALSSDEASPRVRVVHDEILGLADYISASFLLQDYMFTLLDPHQFEVQPSYPSHTT